VSMDGSLGTKEQLRLQRIQKREHEDVEKAAARAEKRKEEELEDAAREKREYLDKLVAPEALEKMRKRWVIFDERNRGYVTRDELRKKCYKEGTSLTPLSR
jgi:alpha-galactosidase/6-phospho-beta-glucosidase family protein